MYIRLVKPSAFLAKYVRYYWILEADNSDGIITERVVPSGAVQLMFHYKNPFTCHTSANIHKKQYQSFITGISSTYADVSTQGESGLLAVTFYPYGACNFFRFPLIEAENIDISLNCLVGRKADLINEMLGDAVSHAERIKIIEHFLYQRFYEVTKSDLKLIYSAISLINKNHGQIQSQNLSNLLAVTQKSLERKFGSLVGKTPKQFSKIVRFQSIINSVSKNINNTYTQTALERGYFDQAHFNKDFKAFSGMSPNDFFKNCPCSSDYYL